MDWEDNVVQDDETALSEPFFPRGIDPLVLGSKSLFDTFPPASLLTKEVAVEELYGAIEERMKQGKKGG